MDTPDFQLVPLTKLRESKLNPRHQPDSAEAFAELVDSVKRLGVLAPLLARPMNGHLEIAAGHRRFRAAKEAKLETIPVCVRAMGDVEFLEVMLIEQLAREDLHPLDEAQGYRVLMDKAGYDVDAVAAKIGKSKSYVYQRLKLLDLTAPARKAFVEEKITAGHAIPLARLQPGDQERALEYLSDQRRFDSMPSVRDFLGWIEEEVHLDLHRAPFKKEDADLVAAAGACTTCPKRTGFTPELFPDVKKKDTCTDGSCFQAKLAAWAIQRRAELAAEGEDVVVLSSDWNPNGKRPSKHDAVPQKVWNSWRASTKGACEHTVTGLIVDGHEIGKTLRLCREPSKCAAHKGERQSRAAIDAGGSTHLAEQKKREEKARRFRSLRHAVLNAILEKVPARLQRADLELLARAQWRRLLYDGQKIIAERREWNKEKGKGEGLRFDELGEKKIAAMSDHDLARFQVEMALGADCHVATYDDRPGEMPLALAAAAKRYRVNAATLRKGLEAVWKKADRERAARQKAAAARAKAAAKKAAEERQGEVAQRAAAKQKERAATAQEESAEASALRVPCPSCDAKVGKQCNRPSGHRVFGGGVHAGRQKAAAALHTAALVEAHA